VTDTTFVVHDLGRETIKIALERSGDGAKPLVLLRAASIRSSNRFVVQNSLRRSGYPCASLQFPIRFPGSIRGLLLVEHKNSSRIRPGSNEYHSRAASMRVTSRETVGIDTPKAPRPASVWNNHHGGSVEAPYPACSLCLVNADKASARTARDASPYAFSLQEEVYQKVIDYAADNLPNRSRRSDGNLDCSPQLVIQGGNVGSMEEPVFTRSNARPRPSRFPQQTRAAHSSNR